METTRDTGRRVGALLLLQAVSGALGNLVLLKPAIAPPGFLGNAAAHALELRLAVLCMLASAALSVAVAIAAWPVLRAASRTLAMWLFALATAGLALNAVEGTTLLSMLSLSEAYSAADPVLAGQHELLASTVRGARNATHYLKLIVGVGAILVLQAALARHALAPRLLAGAAVVATCVQLVAVTLPLFGARIDFRLLAPAGVLYLLLAAWLLMRGFATTPRLPAAERAS